MATVTARSKPAPNLVRLAVNFALDIPISHFWDKEGITTADEFMRDFLSYYREDELLDVIWEAVDIVDEGSNHAWHITITDIRE